MRIEKLEYCTGCAACFSVCPKSAIIMSAESDGFLYPEINEIKCIKCGLCEKVCPVLNPIKKENEDTKAFIIINRNESIREESSSGGVFSAIAEQIIRMNGIVFGAAFDNSFNVYHTYTDKIEELYRFRGSKYVQSIIGQSYKDCKSFLEQGKKVLFSGTPCQIAGLKAFLGKDYDNLSTIDFICHGIPSPKVWNAYKSYCETLYSSKIINVNFRNKITGWKNYSIVLSFENGKLHSNTVRNDPYMRFFLDNVDLRQSCYNCSSKGIERISDITMGDFWGIQHEYPEFDNDRGVSFVTIHNVHGVELVKSLDNCVIKEVSVEKGSVHNISMTNSVSMNTKRYSFFSDLNNTNFETLIKKYSVDNFMKKIKRKIVIVLRKMRKVLIKNGK